MKRLLLLVALAAPVFAQCSASVTNPASGATLKDWAGNTAAISLSNCPTAALVQWYVDAYPATNPGASSPLIVSGNAGALAAAGVSVSPPWSFDLNSFMWANSTGHTISATVADATGAIIATASPVSFTIANTWPVAAAGTACPFSVTTGTPFSSPWSGTVNVTATLGGGCSSDSVQYTFYLNGVFRFQAGFITAGSFTLPLDTTAVDNSSSAVVAVNALDFTNGQTYTGYAGYVGAAGEQSNIVTINNGRTPMEVRNTSSATGGGGRVLYLAPTHTVTLTPKLIATDESDYTSTFTSAGGTFYYASGNTAVATVSAPSGTSTTVTALSEGAAQIIDMAGQTTVIDAYPVFSGTFNFISSTLNMSGPHLGWTGRMVVETSSANGCIPGVYYIATASPSAGGYYTVTNSLGSSQNIGFFTTLSSGPCTIVTGPTRVAWAQVNATGAADSPPIPYLTTTGQVSSTYNNPSAVFINSVFAASTETTSQRYPVPYVTSFCNSGFNAMEWSDVDNGASSWAGMGSSSALAADLATYYAGIKSKMSGGGCNSFITFSGSNWCCGGSNAYYAGQGGSSARNGSSWMASGVATLSQAILNANALGGNQAIYDTATDEASSLAMNINPAQGPVVLGNVSNIQNWLGTSASITVTSSTITVNIASTGPYGTYSLWQPGDGIVITGSTQGFNTPSGGPCPPITTIDATHFSFPNTASYFSSGMKIASGTYGMGGTADVGLRIWVSTACEWFTPPGGGSATDFQWDDDAAYMFEQWRSVSGHIAIAPSIAAPGSGDVGPGVVRALNGTGNGQSITPAGTSTPVTYLGETNDQYWTHGFDCEVYLDSKMLTNGYINDTNNRCSVEALPYLRSLYGSYSPSKPLITITQGSFAVGGFFPAYGIPVTSCSGNTITLASDPHLKNILPGASHMWITGSSDPNCNSNQVILSAQGTVLKTALAASTVTCVDPCSSHNLASATVTFQNGDTACSSGCTYGAMYEIQADGMHNEALKGTNTFDYGATKCSATGSAAILAHRGQTMTFSGVTGTDASYFNGLTAIYDIENLAQPTTGNGTTSSCANWWRQVPAFSGTGGTAYIVPDGGFVYGRNVYNAFAPGNTTPGGSGLSIVALLLSRSAGGRYYTLLPNPNAYNPTYSINHNGGWPIAGGQSDSCAGSDYPPIASYNTSPCATFQFYAHPNAENGYAVPDWHSAGGMSMLASRIAPLYLGGTAWDSADYGDVWESATINGSAGTIHVIGNFSEATETRTVTLTPYETSGQSIVLWLWDQRGIKPLTIIPPGTSTYSLTLTADEAAIFAAPTMFAGYLNEPTITTNLSDTPTAVSAVAACGHDQYLLPLATPVNLGSAATAVLPFDRTIGPIFCQTRYLNSSGVVVGTGLQQF